MNMKRPAALAERLGPSDSMRRLQIGIAGVLVVLLLVGLAGLIGDRAREQAAAIATDPVAVEQAEVGIEKGSGAALEELGVQPVTTPSDGAEAAKAPATATAPAALPDAAPKVPDLEPDPELQRARNKKGQ